MHLKRCVNYVMLLIDESITSDQYKCLLATANECQLNAISEVIYNALNNYDNLKVNKLLAKDLNKYSGILRGVIDIDKSFKSRIRILRKHIKICGRIIRHLSKSIKTALKE